MVGGVGEGGWRCISGSSRVQPCLLKVLVNLSLADRARVPANASPPSCGMKRLNQTSPKELVIPPSGASLEARFK